MQANRFSPIYAGRSILLPSALKNVPVYMEKNVKSRIENRYVRNANIEDIFISHINDMDSADAAALGYRSKDKMLENLIKNICSNGMVDMPLYIGNSDILTAVGLGL